MDTDRLLSFVIGLFSGGIVGVAAVMLFTPQSGRDMRQSVATRYGEILESGKQAMSQRRQALEAEYKARIQIPLNPPAE
jgi:gas vesicle protein